MISKIKRKHGFRDGSILCSLMLSVVDSKENSATSKSHPVTEFSGEMSSMEVCFVCLFLKHDGNETGGVTSDGFVAAAFNPVTIGVMKMNKVGAIFCFHYHPRGWDRKGFILCHCHFSLLSLS